MYRPATNCNPGNGLVQVCMMECSSLSQTECALGKTKRVLDKSNFIQFITITLSIVQL